MQLKYTIPIVCLSLILSACDGTSDSEDIRTSGLHATMRVTASENDRSEISVRLRVGDRHSDTYLSLTNGDQLQATLNSTVTEFVDIKDGSRYRGSFNSSNAGAENASYRISFIRPNDTDALNSIVTMPPRLENLATDPLTSFSRGSQGLTITWDATSADFRVPITLSGDCVDNISVDAYSSVGVYVLNPRILASNSTIEESCELTITAEVTNTGTLDTNFGEGGSITAVNTSSVQIITEP